MTDPIESAITAEHDRQERAWNEHLTVDDRELIERLRRCSPEPGGDPKTKLLIEELADRLQSLLSLLERVWACRVDLGQGRFVNLEKLWPVIDDIGVALTQTEEEDARTANGPRHVVRRLIR